jgi:hypothetical protein
MNILLPRFNAIAQRLEDERRIARIVLEAGVAEAPATVSRATLAGDPRRLRGIPMLGRGVGGAQVGTRPLEAVLAKEARSELRLR